MDSHPDSARDLQALASAPSRTEFSRANPQGDAK